MTRRAARRFAIVFFLAYALSLTWPGVLPFNRIRPLVFGLPFNFFCVSLWVVLGLAVFGVLEYVETRASGTGDAPGRPRQARSGE